MSCRAGQAGNKTSGLGGWGPAGQVRKYTFERDATGCLEHDELAALERRGEHRAQRHRVGCGEEPPAELVAPRLEYRHELAHGREQVRLEEHELLGDLG